MPTGAQSVAARIDRGDRAILARRFLTAGSVIACSSAYRFVEVDTGISRAEGAKFRGKQGIEEILRAHWLYRSKGMKHVLYSYGFFEI